MPAAASSSAAAASRAEGAAASRAESAAASRAEGAAASRAESAAASRAESAAALRAEGAAGSGANGAEGAAGSGADSAAGSGADGAEGAAASGAERTEGAAASAFGAAGGEKGDAVMDDAIWRREDREDWTAELGNAHAAFERGRHWGLEWAMCVKGFFDFENAWGFGEGSLMPMKNRPHQVLFWIGRGRKWGTPPCLDMEKWAVKWWVWWVGMQPKDRTWDGEALSRPEGADWSQLALLYGKNGLLQVMVTLYWLGEVVMKANAAEEKSEWVAAVTDVTWAFAQLLESGEIDREEDEREVTPPPRKKSNKRKNKSLGAAKAQGQETHKAAARTSLRGRGRERRINVVQKLVGTCQRGKRGRWWKGLHRNLRIKSVWRRVREVGHGFVGYGLRRKERDWHCHPPKALIDRCQYSTSAIATKYSGDAGCLMFDGIAADMTASALAGSKEPTKANCRHHTIRRILNRSQVAAAINGPVREWGDFNHRERDAFNHPQATQENLQLCCLEVGFLLSSPVLFYIVFMARLPALPRAAAAAAATSAVMSILHSFALDAQMTFSQLSWPRVYVLRHGAYRLHPTQPAVCLVGLQRLDSPGHPVHLMECGLAAGKSITLTGNVPNLVSLEFNDLVLPHSGVVPVLNYSDLVVEFFSSDPFGEPRTISTLRSVVSFALEPTPISGYDWGGRS
ncbi:hypothetical protein K438DRAFT_2058686 [Mycena galopus ATCC 62051]|nr:hypothetical protein K438DRAFT_2058686 [Mycena galopus ATCC 62051]